MNITLYYTASCHLCEEASFICTQAIQLFQALNPNLKETIFYNEIDILNDNIAYQRFELKIPVITIISSNKTETQTICWPFDTDELLHCFMNTTRQDNEF